MVENKRNFEKENRGKDLRKRPWNESIRRATGGVTE